MASILSNVERGIATITLHRPDRLDAFTGEMGAELFGAIERFDRDPQVRAIVVTGSGRAICAGADLDPSGTTFAGDEDGPGFDVRAFLSKRAPQWPLALDDVPPDLLV